MVVPGQPDKSPVGEVGAGDQQLVPLFRQQLGIVVTDVGERVDVVDSQHVREPLECELASVDPVVGPQQRHPVQKRGIEKLAVLDRAGHLSQLSATQSGGDHGTDDSAGQGPRHPLGLVPGIGQGGDRTGQRDPLHPPPESTRSASGGTGGLAPRFVTIPSHHGRRKQAAEPGWRPVLGGGRWERADISSSATSPRGNRTLVDPITTLCDHASS